jgi:hypothetical protein
MNPVEVRKEFTDLLQARFPHADVECIKKGKLHTLLWSGVYRNTGKVFNNFCPGEFNIVIDFAFKDSTARFLFDLLEKDQNIKQVMGMSRVIVCLHEPEIVYSDKPPIIHARLSVSAYERDQIHYVQCKFEQNRPAGLEIITYDVRNFREIKRKAMA